MEPNAQIIISLEEYKYLNEIKERIVNSDIIIQQESSSFYGDKYKLIFVTENEAYKNLKKISDELDNKRNKIAESQQENIQLLRKWTAIYNKCMELDERPWYKRLFNNIKL